MLLRRQPLCAHTEPAAVTDLYAHISFVNCASAHQQINKPKKCLNRLLFKKKNNAVMNIIGSAYSASVQSVSMDLMYARAAHSTFGIQKLNSMRITFSYDHIGRIEIEIERIVSMSIWCLVSSVHMLVTCARTHWRRRRLQSYLYEEMKL